ncbi:MAG: 4-hydroxybenzoate octaprenyltransferase [Planctomycetota bacterium]
MTPPTSPSSRPPAGGASDGGGATGGWAAVSGSARAVAADIKLAHSVFALPFALLAAVMAAAPGGLDSIDGRRFTIQCILVLVAMVTARTAAMLANRILDHRLDAANPRTAGRAIPSGRLSVRAAVTWAIGSAAAFVATTAGFGLLLENWWPLMLSVPVLAWITAYGLFKRFTSLCHLWLGTSLALSPPAAALAVDPAAVLSQPAIWLIATMVLGWVAGFDIIYALQDEAVDRRDGLHSMPSRLGRRRAMLVSRGLHAAAIAALVTAARIDSRFAAPFAVGVGIVAVLLVVEHATVHRWGTSRISLTFFTLNGVISCLLGLLGIIDVLGGG